MAFAAYLVSSADSVFMTMNWSVLSKNGAYRFAITSVACGLSLPITTRLGLRKLRTALPSCKNSGLETTSKSGETPRARVPTRIARVICPAVPTGTVDFVTTTAGCKIDCPISRATFHTWDMFTVPSERGGVPTQQNTALGLAFIASAMLETNVRLSSAMPCFTKSSRSGS